MKGLTARALPRHRGPASGVNRLLGLIKDFRSRERNDGLGDRARVAI
jgi:hypothetical protein